MADKKEKNNDCTQDSVIEIGLQAAVGQRKSKGHKSSVSVLDPAIFISRSCKRFDPFKKKKETEPSDAQTSDEHDTEYLHFRVSFTLEIEIVNFEHARKYEFGRFFDSISVRYLYESPERHVWYPESDRPRVAQINEETTRSINWGVTTGQAGPYPIPAPEIHVQKDRKLAVSHDMESWRKGVCMEKLTDTRKRTKTHHIVVTQKGLPNDPQQCPDHPGKYNECIHWEYQVESKRHTWSPEVYESIAIPITVERMILLDPGHLKPSVGWARKNGYLRFDFVIESRLRTMVPTFPGFANYSKPPEYRYETDTGWRLPTDHFTVCLFGDTKEQLPQCPTINFDLAMKAFYEEAANKPYHNPFFLPSDQCLEKNYLYPARMEEYQKRRQYSDKRKELKAKRLKPHRDRETACQNFTKPLQELERLCVELGKLEAQLNSAHQYSMEELCVEPECAHMSCSIHCPRKCQVAENGYTCCPQREFICKVCDRNRPISREGYSCDCRSGHTRHCHDAKHVKIESEEDELLWVESQACHLCETEQDPQCSTARNGRSSSFNGYAVPEHHGCHHTPRRASHSSTSEDENYRPCEHAPKHVHVLCGKDVVHLRGAIARTKCEIEKQKQVLQRICCESRDTEAHRRRSREERCEHEVDTPRRDSESGSTLVDESKDEFSDSEEEEEEEEPRPARIRPPKVEETTQTECVVPDMPVPAVKRERTAYTERRATARAAAMARVARQRSTPTQHAPRPSVWIRYRTDQRERNLD